MDPESPAEFALRLRIPGWLDSPRDFRQRQTAQ